MLQYIDKFQKGGTISLADAIKDNTPTDLIEINGKKFRASDVANRLKSFNQYLYSYQGYKNFSPEEANSIRNATQVYLQGIMDNKVQSDQFGNLKFIGETDDYRNYDNTGDFLKNKRHMTDNDAKILGASIARDMLGHVKEYSAPAEKSTLDLNVLDYMLRRLGARNGESFDRIKFATEQGDWDAEHKRFSGYKGRMNALMPKLKEFVHDYSAILDNPTAYQNLQNNALPPEGFESWSDFKNSLGALRTALNDNVIGDNELNIIRRLGLGELISTYIPQSLLDESSTGSSIGTMTGPDSITSKAGVTGSDATGSAESGEGTESAEGTEGTTPEEAATPGELKEKDLLTTKGLLNVPYIQERLAAQQYSPVTLDGKEMFDVTPSFIMRFNPEAMQDENEFKRLYANLRYYYDPESETVRFVRPQYTFDRQGGLDLAYVNPMGSFQKANLLQDGQVDTVDINAGKNDKGEDIIIGQYNPSLFKGDQLNTRNFNEYYKNYLAPLSEAEDEKSRNTAFLSALNGLITNNYDVTEVDAAYFEQPGMNGEGSNYMINLSRFLNPEYRTRFYQYNDPMGGWLPGASYKPDMTQTYGPGDPIPQYYLDSTDVASTLDQYYQPHILVGADGQLYYTSTTSNPKTAEGYVNSSGNPRQAYIPISQISNEGVVLAGPNQSFTKGNGEVASRDAGYIQHAGPSAGGKYTFGVNTYIPYPTGVLDSLRSLIHSKKNGGKLTLKFQAGGTVPTQTPKLGSSYNQRGVALKEGENWYTNVWLPIQNQLKEYLTTGTPEEIAKKVEQINNLQSKYSVVNEMWRKGDKDADISWQVMDNMKDKAVGEYQQAFKDDSFAGKNIENIVLGKLNDGGYTQVERPHSVEAQGKVDSLFSNMTRQRTYLGSNADLQHIKVKDANGNETTAQDIVNKSISEWTGGKYALDPTDPFANKLKPIEQKPVEEKPVEQPPVEQKPVTPAPAPTPAPQPEPTPQPEAPKPGIQTVDPNINTQANTAPKRWDPTPFKIVANGLLNVFKNQQTPQDNLPLIDPVELNAIQYGNYAAKSNAQESANRLNAMANNAQTSDAATNFQARLQAAAQGDQAKLQGEAIDDSTMRTTGDRVVDINNQNAIRRNQVATSNASTMWTNRERHRAFDDMMRNQNLDLINRTLADLNTYGQQKKNVRAYLESNQAVGDYINQNIPVNVQSEMLAQWNAKNPTAQVSSIIELSSNPYFIQGTNVDGTDMDPVMKQNMNRIRTVISNASKAGVFKQYEAQYPGVTGGLQYNPLSSVFTQIPMAKRGMKLSSKTDTRYYDLQQAWLELGEEKERGRRLSSVCNYIAALNLNVLKKRL